LTIYLLFSSLWFRALVCTFTVLLSLFHYHRRIPSFIHKSLPFKKNSSTPSPLTQTIFFDMAYSHPRESSGSSAMSHDTELSADARVARVVEDLLAGSVEDEEEDEEEDREKKEESEDEERNDNFRAPPPRPPTPDDPDRKPPGEILRQTLSVRSAVLTSSGFAERLERHIWNVFENAYFRTAHEIAKKKMKKQLVDFLKAWKQRAAEMEVDQDGGFIEFRD
jgi:hypothetical protein